MDIFSIFTLLGGLAFFLYGMTIMSVGLEKMTGGKLEKVLKKMTSNPIKSLFLGAGITIAIQSSSAMTVMLVGMVNSGIMQFQQTIGLIMGSNIGTTLTAWVLSLAGIESNNFFLRLLKPESSFPLAALIGILLILGSKSQKKKDIGNVLVGFAVLMCGMELMSTSVRPLADMPQFKDILTTLTNPILGLIVGAIFTGIIQSSAASVTIMQALSLTGSITYAMAMPVIMGMNIGTCVTALISSIGVNRNAKRVSVIHVLFNSLGAILCLSIVYALNIFFKFSFIDSSVNPAGIALIHSAFNISTTIMLLPFAKLLEKAAILIVKDKDKGEKSIFLDERLLNSPSVAIAECRNLTSTMAELAKDTFVSATNLIGNFDQKEADRILEAEQQIDTFEDKLGTYLVKISSKQLSEEDSREVSTLLHTIGDFERISDHAVNIVRVAQEINDKDILFSKEAIDETKVISSAVQEILDISVSSFVKHNEELATHVEPLEQVIDGLISKAKSRHIARLQHGDCTIQYGFVLSDLLHNFERVSDHCSNIAVCLIQVADNKFDTHKYLNNIKTQGDNLFNVLYTNYKEKYNI